jgi:hypothetical protein
MFHILMPVTARTPLFYNVTLSSLLQIYRISQEDIATIFKVLEWQWIFYLEDGDRMQYSWGPCFTINSFPHDPEGSCTMLVQSDDPISKMTSFVEVQMNAARWIWRLIQFAMSAMFIYLIIFVNESVYWK